MPLPFLALLPLLLQAATVVPEIMKHFDGDDNQKNAKIIGDVVDIAKKVTGLSDPQQAMDIVVQDPKAILDFKLALAQQMLEWDKLFLLDRQSARDRDVKLAEAGFRNTRANWLAMLAIIIVIGCLLIVVWASQIDDFGKGVITLICGRALGWVEQLFSFEFGTTKQSAQQTETIKNMSDTGSK